MMLTTDEKQKQTIRIKDTRNRRKKSACCWSRSMSLKLSKNRREMWQRRRSMKWGALSGRTMKGMILKR